MSTDQDPAGPASRICAGCGEPFQPRRRGRPSLYCRPACRQRAWALRQAEAALLEEAGLLEDADLIEGGPPAPPIPSSSAAASAVPIDTRGWLALLNELTAQLNDPESTLVRRPWEHLPLYDGLGRALSALDAATPGGLEWLDRHD